MDRAGSRICIILNPAAAKGRAEQLRGIIEQQMNLMGADYRVFLTEKMHHGTMLARWAVEDGFDVIVAAGGDGTVNEVVDGMMSAAASGMSLPELGLLPIGRGNDFAYAVGIPKKLKDCCSLLMRGASKPVDIGRVPCGLYPQGRCFVNGVGIGFEPLVTMTAGEFTRISGVPSYILALLKVLAHYPKAVEISMRWNGKKQKIFTQQLSVCNGRRMGGAFIMGPDAVVDDGFLDLCYVNRPVGLGVILSLVGKFFKGTQKQHPYISFDRIKHMVLNAPSGGIVCHADGETISKDTDYIGIDIVSGAVLLIR